MLSNKPYNTSLLPPPQGKTVEKIAFGITSDIVDEIIICAEETFQQTTKFAKQFKSFNRTETARNVWNFLKNTRYITYRLDPTGIQLIKEPAAIISSGYCDCKGYSILAYSILTHLNIPCEFRFVSYSRSPVYTHVYVVVTSENNDEIYIDACLNYFNEEKPFYFKLDKMTKIYRVSGVGTSGLVTTPYEIDPDMNAGVLDLLLARERMELEQQIARGIQGIGTTLDESYDYNLALLNEALRNVDNPDSFIEIAGVGAIGKTKLGKLLSKAGNGIKTAAKAVVKVVTAPVRLLAKGVLEVILPKAAPTFLYLFLKPEDVAKAPVKVQEKRKKQERKAKFITGTIGMKEEHFMGIIRNGIMKQLGKTPEMLLQQYTQPKVSGIGIIPIVLMSAAIGPLSELLGKIMSGFGKKDDTGSPEEMVANDDDWSGYMDSLFVESNKLVDVPPVVETNTNVLSPVEVIRVKSLNTQPSLTETTAQREAGRASLVTSDNDTETGKKDNTLLYVLAGGAGLYFMSQQKKGKR